MFSLKKMSLVITLLTLTISSVFSHLPSRYSASLQMGRVGKITTGPVVGSRQEYVYSNKGEWNKDSVYRGDYTIPAGDTVSCGTFNGKKLWWWAKFYASGENLKPGFCTSRWNIALGTYKLTLCRSYRYKSI